MGASKDSGVHDGLQPDRASEQAIVLTPVRMRSLVTLAKLGSTDQACQVLNLSASTLDGHIRELTAVFGSLFAPTRKGQVRQLTERGEQVVTDCRYILDMQSAMVSRKPATSIRYLPHHSIWVLPAARDHQTNGFPVDLNVLGEHHRALDHFVDRALRPVAAGILDVAVGIDIRSSHDPSSSHHKLTEQLETQTLYRAWLEAMIPTTDTRSEQDSIRIDSLVGDPILTSPRGTRSRTYLERAVGAHFGDNPLNIQLAEYESKVLIIGSHAGLGTTVLPSDVALQFDSSWAAPLAGTPAKNYRWVPIKGSDDKYISYDVVAYRAKKSPHRADAQLLITQLKRYATEVMDAAGRPEATRPQLYNEDV